jgi:hypothetical protein
LNERGRKIPKAFAKITSVPPSPCSAASAEGPWLPAAPPALPFAPCPARSAEGGFFARDTAPPRWKHVDLNRGVLHIRESVYQGHFSSPKTPSSIGDLPLGPQVVTALSQHRQKQGSGSPPDALVFPNEKGGALDRQNLLRRVLYPACEAAGEHALLGTNSGTCMQRC